jgi:7-carboxy-7-deazaguanine synthase
MYISELFSSLQGEGSLVGTPSVFIRTSGCNLRCRWCDTPYTSWHAEGYRMPVDAIVDRIRASPLHHVVITGGEPLLQRELEELTLRLRELGRHITVETAGTVDRPLVCDLLSVSPKTANSDPSGGWRNRHRRQRQDLAPVVRLLAAHPSYQLKFVVSCEGDMAEVHDVVSALSDVPPERVLLMPEGRTAAEVGRCAEEVARLCLEHGFRYTPRLHLDLYGGTRGR